MAAASGATDNIILCSDSYKVTHHLQYPPNTTTVYSYFESRGGKFEKTVFFGLQYILKRWMIGPVVTYEKIAEAKAVYRDHFKRDLFNEDGWKYIVERHNGYLPLRIKSVPEGTVVPYKNVLFTVENTDPECYWLTNFFETLLVQVWYPMTVATNSYHQKEILAKYLNETADNFDNLQYQLHDFGFRGTSSVETAAIGGAAHLINFRGTDTVPALMLVRKYYQCNMAGNSIPASEHSTITTWGKDGEMEAFKNMLSKFPDGAVGVVSDSYDIWHACESVWGGTLKNLVVERGSKAGCCLVVRPDSGDPAEVVVKVLKILGSKFGVEQTTKGFKRLPRYLRVLQGDGISVETLGFVLEAMKKHKWSAENVIFGSGGALLQRVDRDTQKCAYKCSFAIIGEKQVSVCKEPITDLGKKSKKGRLRLERRGDTYVTVEEAQDSDSSKDILTPVFENGRLLKDYSFDEIRKNAEIPLLKNNKM